MSRSLKVLLSLLISLVLIASCSKEDNNKPEQHDDPIDELKSRYDLVLYDSINRLDPVTGWPGVNDCDGTLWAGLACSVGMPVKIELAEYSPGEIHRRPYKSCYTREQGDVGSKSTISRDMLTGYMACLIERKDLPALKRLANYGEKNTWIMGEPYDLVSRVFLGNNLIGLLGRSIYKLSNGDSDRIYRKLPTEYQSVSQDFERHIQVKGILLQSKITGSITDQMLSRLKDHVNAYPDDHLFHAALGKFTGDQSKTIQLLSKENPCTKYVRGENPDLYCEINWLQSAKIVLESANK
jgi:hypothetical protein